MTLALNLGFPRIGERRELKKAVESYWKGETSQEDLLAAGKELRTKHWSLQKNAGIDYPPSNDFSFYDQMLDMSCLLGAVPARYNWSGETVDLDTYFAMARGRQQDGQDVIAMEMTKWFDTNYHYIVPELTKDQSFKISSSKIFDEHAEAKAAGVDTVPVIIGPVTYLSLAKASGAEFETTDLIDRLVPVYADILNRLHEQGALWVQIDEPCLCLDLSAAQKEAYTKAYVELSKLAPNTFISLATYFEGIRDNEALAFSLPVAAISVDLVRYPNQLDSCITKAKETGKGLRLGLVDGRNIWRNDLSASLEKLEKAIAALGADNVQVCSSCSLLHSPFTLENENTLDSELKSWMAFAVQKLDEIATLAKGANEGRDAIADKLADSDAAQASRKSSARIHNKAVQDRLAAATPEMAQRKSPFSTRAQIQREKLGLPAFPTTTIGSFPQTQEIRKARAAFKKGNLDENAYEQAMKDEIGRVVDYQHAVDLDVLVHGEPERNDMVEYFGEQLEGFTFSKLGWVQSYGSRCVKPPIIFGDISRPNAMTVKWAEYAQSLTKKKMKGMLTGPITILQWSFVRNDQPEELTAKQIAFAIRDEVVDLESAGIDIIQIDEAAIREGLPIRKEDWKDYLNWSVEAFRICASGVKDSTQIHTHMCYSEFNDMIEAIAAMDADVISIETSRSQMELLDAFERFQYPNEIGPGVYDIHSPRIPSTEEMTDLLEKAAKVIPVEQLWVNPDCGLKTRGWAEVEPALKNMVDAAKQVRQKLAS
ncbi:MAG: 5-methyltetrahydropteroyltriglutamate--homocysteine S-methyltransferase [Micavibrio sp.]|nr:5-methyltetrahydropteroyltriglutamate--homocysteine S-methyltransferase [Micavibrio sp.]